MAARRSLEIGLLVCLCLLLESALLGSHCPDYTKSFLLGIRDGSGNRVSMNHTLREDRVAICSRTTPTCTHSGHAMDAHGRTHSRLVLTENPDWTRRWFIY